MLCQGSHPMTPFVLPSFTLYSLRSFPSSFPSFLVVFIFLIFHHLNPPTTTTTVTTTKRAGGERPYEMVGLSVVLEGYEDNITEKSSRSSSKSNYHQVISKASMIKPSSSSSPTPPSSPSPFTKRNSFNLSSAITSSSSGFLDHCFLCKQKLLPTKDIYMYKGDRAFCSEECRCRQIFMDEEETMKAKTDYCSSAASSSRKGAKKGANGFAY